MFDCCDCNQLAGTRAERNRVWSPEDLRIEMARGQAMPGRIDSSTKLVLLDFGPVWMAPLSERAPV